MIRPMHVFTAAAVFVSLSACGEVVSVDAEFDAAPAIDAVVLGPCEVDDILIENLFDCFLQAQCTYGVQCLEYGGTIEECVDEANAGGGSFQRIVDANAAGKANYDGKKAASCLQDLLSDTCPEDPNRQCEDVFEGTVDEGEGCFQSDECSGTDANCQQDNCPLQCCEGVCENAAKIGEDCSVRGCERDAHCSGLSGDRKCVSGDEDSECLEDYNCDRGLFCGTENTCTGELPLNAACDRSTQCDDSATCVGANTEEGGVCRRVDMVGVDCDSYCDGNLYCASAEGVELGSCTLKKSENMPCGGRNECEQGLLCHPVSETCRSRPGLEEPCASYSCQLGLFCTSELLGGGALGVCAEPVVNDLACDSDDHCESQVCINNLCEAYVSCYL